MHSIVVVVVEGRSPREAKLPQMKKITIWFAEKLARTTPKGAPYLARHCRRNMVGSPPRGTHDGRLVGGGARDDDPDVDARRTRGFIQVQAVKST
jgi:hypothetical protein